MFMGRPMAGMTLCGTYKHNGMGAQVALMRTIDAIRKRRGITISSLARVVGVDRGAYTRWRRGDNQVRLIKVCVMAEAVGLGLHWTLEPHDRSILDGAGAELKAPAKPRKR